MEATEKFKVGRICILEKFFWQVHKSWDKELEPLMLKTVAKSRWRRSSQQDLVTVGWRGAKGGWGRWDSGCSAYWRGWGGGGRPGWLQRAHAQSAALELEVPGRCPFHAGSRERSGR